MTLAELNRSGREQFAGAIGGVFDGAPWVAERAWRRRPFASFDDLSTKLIQEVQAASGEEQLALLCAVPVPANASLRELREKYRKKFGFPFIYAMKGDDAAGEGEALRRRLRSAPDQEFQVALGNVFRIARFRLEAMID